MSFAITKIQQPRPRGSLLLPRPALEQELVAGLGGQRVVLLQAPAGYGKTALLSRALQHLPAGHVAAWISLDPGDDLQRLLECLMAALEPFDPPWRVAPEGLVSAAQRQAGQGAAAVVDELVNTLEACDVVHGVIVFDDLHHVDDTASFAFIDRMLQRMGVRWTLAVTTRHELPLRLARLRAAGDLLDIGQPQLEFSRDEVGALLSGAGLDATQAAALHERTGGWAAGLRLALSGASGGGGLRHDRAAFEFLASEVLANLEPALRDFLLRTSVLHELDAPRCAAVSGDADAARRLEQIERQGLFASFVDDDAGQPTLRLHDLFRDALQHRLRLEQPLEWAPLLKRAAAVETDPVRHQGLLLAAGEAQQAAKALLAACAGLITSGAVRTVLHLLEQFPKGFAETSAEFNHAAGIAKWNVWDTAAAERHHALAEALYAERGEAGRGRLMRAQRAITLVALGRLGDAGRLVGQLQADPAAETDDATRIHARLAVTWLTLERCSFDAVADVFERLVEALEASPHLDSWFYTVPAPRQITCRGILPSVARWAAGALAVAGDRPVPLRSLALLNQGWVALLQGRLADAQPLLARAEADARWTGQQVIASNHGLALRAAIDALRGRPESALQALHERIAGFPLTYGDWGMWHTLFFNARIAACCGDAALAREWLQQLKSIEPALPDADPQRLWAPRGLAGTIAWLEGRPDAAIDAWRDALGNEQALDLLGQTREVRVRLACALAARGDLDGAAKLLEPMLARPADGPGGALFGRDALFAVAALDWRGRLAPSELATIASWAAALGAQSVSHEPREAASSASAAAGRQAAAAIGDGLDEPLSQREREVLALIASGQSNKQIARVLDLSPHTVKRHVANILGKLGLTSRGQAAAWHHMQPGN